MEMNPTEKQSDTKVMHLLERRLSFLINSSLLDYFVILFSTYIYIYIYTKIIK